MYQYSTSTHTTQSVFTNNKTTHHIGTNNTLRHNAVKALMYKYLNKQTR